MSITINLATVSYPIIIERSLRHQIKARLEAMGNHRLAIVTDSTVWQLYGEALQSELSSFQVDLTILPPGEKSKSQEHLMMLYRKWLDFGLTRKDLVLALGGGVIGDLTGYAAATYLRGVSFIQMPTTLLSQVDSSIGGKVAIDLPEGKNLIGTFYHPKEVWIDSDFLSTLSDRVLKDGMAEVVKAGCIMDEKLYQLMKTISIPLESAVADEIIERAIRVKKQLVESDEKEIGLRKLLNFGHTVGHALEAHGAYSKWTHGEAVAMGMVWITHCSEAQGLSQNGATEELCEILEKIGLPTKSEVSLDELMKWLARDKKKTSSGIELALMKEPGVSFLKEIPQEALYTFLLRK